jgi:adenylate kinase family enzyme
MARLNGLAMRKVAVFGNAGGGKSTLARRLAELTGLPLFVLDLLEYPDGYRRDRDGGGKISDEDYSRLHREILDRDAWVIDGYGGFASAWRRFAVADTLVYVDLPLAWHYWGVTKRLVKGFAKTPPGWPAHSPLLRSSLDSYRVVWLCHTRLTQQYRRLVAEATSKQVHHLRSYAEINRFLAAVQTDCRGPASGGDVSSQQRS